MSEKSATGKQTAKGDDRNLVSAEQSDAAVPAEEWLLDLWKKYRVAIIAAIVAIAAIIVGRGAVLHLQAKQEAETRAAFAAATGQDELLAFARQHEGHSLGAVALLNVGDEYFRDGDYAAAANYYAEAEKQLDDKVLADRARLGRGMALVHAGQRSEGVALLQALADDTEATEGLRAEALFHLASLAHEDGDDARAREILDQLETIAPTGIWASRASALRGRLAEPEEAAEPTVKLPTGN